MECDCRVLGNDSERGHSACEELDVSPGPVPTGVVARLCPRWVYWRLYSEQRQHVRSQYEIVSDEYQSLVATLLRGYSQSVEALSASQASAIATEIRDLSVTELCPQLTDVSDVAAIQDHVESVTAELDRSRALCDATTDLLDPNVEPLLRDDERVTLDHLGEVFEAYNETLSSARDRVRETARVLKNIDDLRAELHELETQMEPYLNYQQYEIDPELHEQLADLEDTIDDIEQGIVPELLTEECISKIVFIQTRTTELHQHLVGYRADFVYHAVEMTKREVRGGIADLERTLRPARHGNRLDDVSAVRDSIDDLRGKISELFEYPHQHALNGRLTGVEELIDELDDLEAFVDTKAAFDRHIEEIEARATALRDEAAPYLEYEAYLDHRTRSRIGTYLSETAERLNRLRSQADLDKLTQTDRRRLTDITDGIGEVRRRLDGYNETFVEREREQCEGMFTGVGPNDLDLTPEQQRAVIRNGVYNRVIAGAGTGKTLVLTTRVAYLVKQQQIPPHRILVTSFTGEVIEEIETRLEEHFGIEGVEVTTLHSFGRGIVGSDEGASADVINPHQITNFIDQTLLEAREGEHTALLDHFYQFLVHYDDVYLRETEFETKEEYVRARASQQYQTLKGEEVRSQAEKRIADFLFLNQIDYRYEDIATWADTADDKGPYAPDFYLPEDDTYIEHWGLTENGVASWFSVTTEEYKQKRRWARSQFAEHDPTLVETFEFEHESGELEQALEERLTTVGVGLNQMGFEEFVNSVFDYNRREGRIKNQLREFITNAKQFELKPDDIEAATNEQNRRQFHFVQCGIRLLQQYQRHLIEHELIDFPDMITQSIELLQKERDADHYDHVLVDEVQDISAKQIELLQEVTGHDGARLFAVGDDWQSIYSFRGAVVKQFINFTETFGEGPSTRLTENFRSPQTVVEAGNALIEHNDAQVPKEVVPTTGQDTPILVHKFPGGAGFEYPYRVARQVKKRIDAYLSRGASPGDIMILCRFDGATRYLDEVKDELREDGIPFEGKSENDIYHGSGETEGFVSVYSVHQSKGREADHVVLVHASEGPFGFPPEDRKDELLQPVKPIDIDRITEERRMFYVALTRAERTLDILARPRHISRFVEEIEEYTETVDRSAAVEQLGDVGSSMSVTARVERLYDDIHEKKHQNGILADRFEGTARFVSWKSTDPPTLDVGQWYRFEGVEVSEYNGKKELVVTGWHSVGKVDEPADPRERAALPHDD